MAIVASHILAADDPLGSPYVHPLPLIPLSPSPRPLARLALRCVRVHAVYAAQLTDTEMRTLLTSLDVNGDGEVDLWELCRFLVSRHDEIVGELDDAWSLDEAFNLFEVRTTELAPRWAF